MYATTKLSASLTDQLNAIIDRCSRIFGALFRYDLKVLDVVAEEMKFEDRVESWECLHDPYYWAKNELLEMEEGLSRQAQVRRKLQVLP